MAMDMCKSGSRISGYFGGINRKNHDARPKKKYKYGGRRISEKSRFQQKLFPYFKGRTPGKCYEPAQGVLHTSAR